MIAKVKDIMYECGADTISVVYTFNHNTEVLHDFFEAAGLDELKDPSPDRVFSAKLSDIPQKVIKEINDPDIVFGSKLTSSQWNAFISDLDKLRNEDGQKEIPILRDRDYYSGKLSFFHIKDTKVNGCFLVSTYDDELTVDYVFMKKSTPKGLYNMITSSIVAAKRTHGDDTVIRFTVINDSIVKLMEAFGLSDRQPDGIVMIQTASV